jgi:hypothetical protein
MAVLFLQPIYDVLGQQKTAAARHSGHSAGCRSLMKTKRMALTGAVLVVVSSTVLCINLVGNCGSLLELIDRFFGPNLDSVLNNVGMPTMFRTHAFPHGSSKNADNLAALQSPLCPNPL